MRYTDAPARRAEILRRLEADGYVGSAEIADEFGVSEVTIRRDVRRLSVDGLVQAVVGGARLAGTVRVPFEQRHREGAAEKQAIAEACAPLLAGASTVALDAGTTVAPLATLVAPDTVVVSHSVPVIIACSARTDISLLGLGGLYQHDTRAFAGPTTKADLDAIALDVAVLSATAIDETSILCASVLDAEIKRSMADNARRTILLIDHTKLGGHAPIRIGPISMVDVVITGPGADPDEVARLRAADVEVIVVEQSAAEQAS